MQKLKNLKKDQLLILLLTGVLLLVIAMPAEDTGTLSGNAPARETEEAAQTGSGAGAAREMELALEELLGQVSGVGKVRVMIALKSDGRKVVEKDLDEAEQREESTADGQTQTAVSKEGQTTTVYQRDSQGNEIPYVTEQQAPEIIGVAVAAQGGGSPAVKQEITEAVMALFGVEAHKIKVMKME